MRRQGVRVVELDPAVRALNYASGIKDACDVVSMSRSRPGSVESNCTDGGDEAGSELVISAASTVSSEKPTDRQTYLELAYGLKSFKARAGLLVYCRRRAACRRVRKTLSGKVEKLEQLALPVPEAWLEKHPALDGRTLYLYPRQAHRRPRAFSTALFTPRSLGPVACWSSSPAEITFRRATREGSSEPAQAQRTDGAYGDHGEPVDSHALVAAPDDQDDHGKPLTESALALADAELAEWAPSAPTLLCEQETPLSYEGDLIDCGDADDPLRAIVGSGVGQGTESANDSARPESAISAPSSFGTVINPEADEDQENRKLREEVAESYAPRKSNSPRSTSNSSQSMISCASTSSNHRRGFCRWRTKYRIFPQSLTAPLGSST
ncbi:hypothetical protein A1Q1_00903 [Trichosporon asahii var. asahii CBS 2479]|uniref:Uncharacterized protein n=1 Tax=Trichosporon asahii var. asahii (strain ATCC 90039 / CBS 2479 / JCM 2466 / KCTC 7840 / NBRC 103889/ NCYC 2677 / UAMH 7654) TaxID=1186058 RepID=J4UEZ7_TRIAS|nr:hypothetical protein A1Q1_00903 [Trichosporon asahii var. asahii CBS 2479]EJT49890.1 hypothetical protein A1Q1_00903 [Trichosporon asahii var. asahii CBS 2479]